MSRPVTRAGLAYRFSFIMAVIGSGMSLGNLWRFPYLTGSNGGGAFVLLYVFFVAAVGMPVLIAELMLGRTTRRNLIGAVTSLDQVNHLRWRWLGFVGLLANIVVMSYYAVISGWVIHFIVQGSLGAFAQGPSRAGVVIDNLLDHGMIQVGLTSLHLLITTMIVGRAAHLGVERWSRIFVVFFVLIFAGLLMHSLLLPGAGQALRFLFYPDFSKLSPTSIVAALGHACFTLSVGFGAMVAYGSYLKKEVPLATEGVIMASTDTFLSLCAGLLIFPILFTYNMKSTVGPALLFKTMPVVFGSFALGSVIGVAFFVCLYFAALSSSILLAEATVTYLTDEKKYSRRAASIVVGFTTFIFAIISALSSSAFREVKLGELGILEIMDQIIINWTVPIVGIGVALFVGWKLTEERMREEFIDPSSLSSVQLFSTWRKAVRWIAPIIAVIMVIIQVVSLIWTN